MDREPGNSQFLRPGEVASLLHVSPKTMTRWAREGRLLYLVTLGGYRRVGREEMRVVEAKMRLGRPAERLE